jgi:acetyl-CoA C-acetyltransferase
VVVVSRLKAGNWAPILAAIGVHGVVAGPDPSPLSQPFKGDRQGFAMEGPGARRPVRDQRGIHVGGHPVHARARRHRRERQCQRPRDLDGMPVGMSGARIALRLAHELKRRGGGSADGLGDGGLGEGLVIRVAS